MINSLPEKLRKLRQQYGYSQKQIADKLDLSPSIVSGYETGERTPSLESLLAISYIYNCSVDFLLGKEKTKKMIDVDGLTEGQIKALEILILNMK